MSLPQLQPFCNRTSQRDLATVCSLLEEALPLFREIGDKWGIAFTLMLSGRLTLQQGDVARAHSLAEESVLLCREIGHRWNASQSIAILAKVANIQRDQAAARALYEESLDLAREVGDKVLVASSLESLADVAAAKGEPVWATRLWGVAEVLRETIGAPMPPVYRADYDRSVAAARAQLGEEAFVAAWAKGRTLSLEQVIEEALKMGG